MYQCMFEENLSTGSEDIVGTKICHLNLPVTLKVRSRSSKQNQLLSLHQQYIQVNLVELHQLVHEISWVQIYVM